MEKEFVTYDQALKLKELGFNDICIAYYTVVPEDNFDYFSIPEQSIINGKALSVSKNYNTKFYEDEGTISAPLKQQVFKWFREKHGLFSYPNKIVEEQGVWYYFVIDSRRTNVVEGSFSYDEAESKCIDLLIKIKEDEKSRTRS